METVTVALLTLLIHSWWPGFFYVRISVVFLPIIRIKMHHEFMPVWMMATRTAVFNAVWHVDSV